MKNKYKPGNGWFLVAPPVYENANMERAAEITGYMPKSASWLDLVGAIREEIDALS